MAQRDEQGLYVPGYRVAPDCGESFSDQKSSQLIIATMRDCLSSISLTLGLLALSSRRLTYYTLIEVKHSIGLKREP
jgi:hypothetical protein